MVQRQAARPAGEAGRPPRARRRRSDGDGANRRVRGLPEPAASRVSPLHVHWYRRVGDDPYSGAGLYACRCGVVRPGF